MPSIGDVSLVIRTCEQDLEMILVARSLVTRKLNGVKSWHVAPEVLCGVHLVLYKAILIDIRMGKNTVLFHPV